MNVLLLGGQGMAGHLIASHWLRVTDHNLTVTIRPVVRQEASAARTRRNALPESREITVRELDVRDFHEVERTVREAKPDVILNAVGVLNEEAEKRPSEAYLVNGLLPHWLAYLADRHGARLIHISTDCVFSGDRGNYREDDPTDGRSVYARTKALGEIRDSRHLTVRTSIIGPDVKTHGIGLMQWFLSQHGEVAGYTKVPWNGVTTLELAKAVLWFAERPEIGGLVHLTSPEPVSKHDLLLLMQKKFGKTGVTVVPQDEPRIDRTLNATRKDVAYSAPDHARMLEELREWMCLR
ncbi:sugar nucleotide-binding protein [Cohnella sp. CFH 77786]|uniref:dTDP-4-dehydrorhamnose reductase family protein n=1 Tax=Cohnella sp. CFH 77786 TaxID=2662265 RepID=UPI001C609ECA|nr:SDR family oxidoreductase [Cohnella sp. CFH 77786]MBW5447394.1 sugar nucleotide-binding protein [Cohnella sp. CFH 77786]